MKLFMHSLECYFGAYFCHCFTNWEINTKITFEWLHKKIPFFIAYTMYVTLCIVWCTSNYSNCQFPANSILNNTCHKPLVAVTIDSIPHIWNIFYKFIFVLRMVMQWLFWGYGFSQWNTTLQSNVSSHWLRPYPEKSLWYDMFQLNWFLTFMLKIRILPICKD